MEKFYIITTDEKGRSLLYDYESDIKFLEAVGQLIAAKKPILAIKGILVLQINSPS